MEWHGTAMAMGYIGGKVKLKGTSLAAKLFGKLLSGVALGLVLVAGSVNGVGQETRASLGGKVTDPAGAVIQKAIVVVTADATGVTQKTPTNSSGDWRIQYLVPGHYHFEVTAPGFKRSEHPSIELQVSDQKTVDTLMEVGTTSETITVEATTPLIETTAAVSGTVITTEELQELPSQSNAPTMLIGLTPGASVSAGQAGGVYLWSNIGLSATTVDASGSGNQAVNYTLDGGTDTNNGGQVAFEPPMDAVAEFRVATNAYDAAIGRQSGATISMSMKTGTKAFHGVLYEINQNNFLNADRYENKATNTPVPPVHTNEYGGTLGGPVWIPKLYDGRRKKTFFFFSYDGIRNKAPANTGFISLPTMLERTGDFSRSFTTQTVTNSNGTKTTTTYPVQIFDPATINKTTNNRTAFPGAVIPSGRIDPIATAILNLIPPPDNLGDGASTDSNNYVKREEQNDTFSSYALRVDQSWNNANHSYVNLRKNTWSELSLDPFGPTNVLQGWLQTRQNLGMTIDHTIVLSNNVLLDLRDNVVRYVGTAATPSAGVSSQTLGFGSAYTAQQQFSSLPLFNGIVTGAENGGLGTSQGAAFSNDTDQDMTASITHIFKNHNFRYGAEYLIQQEGTGSLGDSGGQFTFGNNWTIQNSNAAACQGCGSNIASLLLGLPSSGFLPHSATGFWSQKYMAYYFQDDWRTTTRLTLNFGLRWDLELPVTERNNSYYSRFDPNYVLAPVTTPSQANYAKLIAGTSTSTGVQLLQQYRSNAASFVSTGGILYAGQNGTSASVENAQYKYFQPRLGFAYQVHKDTVLRGGLGRFVQASFNTGNQGGYSTSTPFVATTDNYTTSASTLSNPYPNGTLAPTGNTLGELTNAGSTGSFTDPNIGRVYVDEASASLQQQIKDYVIEIGGTFNETHGLSVSDPLNSNANGYNINNTSAAAWHAAFDPAFDSTGRPVDTLAGNVQVTNPFKGVAYITNGLQNNSTVTAYSLLRPNPLVGNLLDNEGKGKVIYYALNTKIEKRFHNGFSILQSFTWSRKTAENTFFGPQVAAQIINRRLDPGDQRFHYVLTPVYELPFGRGKYFGNHVGKLTNELVGGWEVTGIYNFQSGTPLNLPTNSSFFQGGDPSIGNKTPGHWFDTSKFVPYPTRSTTVAQLQAYPAWTGVQSLPGYNYVPSATDATRNGVYQDFTTRVTYNQSVFGDIRNPYITDFTIGLRKSFPITESIRFQLKIDAFNALNHPRFGNIDTGPSDLYFGALNGSSTLAQLNSPRTINLAGKLYF